MSIPRVLMVVSVSLLLWLGLTALESASVAHEEIWFYQQLQWISCGVLAAVVAGCIGPGPLNKPKLVWGLYAMVVILLILVRMPGLNHPINRSWRWIWGFQPSELAKPILILLLAHYCSLKQGVMAEVREGFTMPMRFVLPVVGLVFIEFDWGTAILLFAVSCLLLWVAGTRWVWLILTAMLAALALVVVLRFDFYHFIRFFAYGDPERYKDSFTHQLWMGLLALASGHWWGAGWGEGILRMGFVPEQHTDFILSLIGEEMGFRGTSLVILLFTSVTGSGLWIAWHANDSFSQFVAFGLTALIGLQAFINLGVVLAVLPTKGIALPLVSYGGSSIVTMMACIGLLLGIEARTSVQQALPRSLPSNAAAQI